MLKIMNFSYFRPGLPLGIIKSMSSPTARFFLNRIVLRSGKWLSIWPKLPCWPCKTFAEHVKADSNLFLPPYPIFNYISLLYLESIDFFLNRIVWRSGKWLSIWPKLPCWPCKTFAENVKADSNFYLPPYPIFSYRSSCFIADSKNKKATKDLFLKASSHLCTNGLLLI